MFKNWEFFFKSGQNCFVHLYPFPFGMLQKTLFLCCSFYLAWAFRVPAVHPTQWQLIQGQNKGYLLQVGNDINSITLVRQWPEVSDFVARFCTFSESENTRTCTNRTRFCVWSLNHNICVYFSLDSYLINLSTTSFQVQKLEPRPELDDTTDAAKFYDFDW